MPIHGLTQSGLTLSALLGGPVRAPVVVAGANDLLLEDGFFLLLEDGFRLLLEA